MHPLGTGFAAYRQLLRSTGFLVVVADFLELGVNHIFGGLSLGVGCVLPGGATFGGGSLFSIQLLRQIPGCFGQLGGGRLNGAQIIAFQRTLRIRNCGFNG